MAPKYESLEGVFGRAPELDKLDQMQRHFELQMSAPKPLFKRLLKHLLSPLGGSRVLSNPFWDDSDPLAGLRAKTFASCLHSEDEGDESEVLVFVTDLNTRAKIVKYVLSIGATSLLEAIDDFCGMAERKFRLKLGKTQACSKLSKKKQDEQVRESTKLFLFQTFPFLKPLFGVSPEQSALDFERNLVIENNLQGVHGKVRSTDIQKHANMCCDMGREGWLEPYVDAALRKELEKNPADDDDDNDAMDTDEEQVVNIVPPLRPHAPGLLGVYAQIPPPQSSFFYEDLARENREGLWEQKMYHDQKSIVSGATRSAIFDHLMDLPEDYAGASQSPEDCFVGDRSCIDPHGVLNSRFWGSGEPLAASALRFSLMEGAPHLNYQLFACKRDSPEAQASVEDARSVLLDSADLRALFSVFAIRSSRLWSNKRMVGREHTRFLPLPGCTYRLKRFARDSQRLSCVGHTSASLGATALFVVQWLWPTLMALGLPLFQARATCWAVPHSKRRGASIACPLKASQMVWCAMLQHAPAMPGGLELACHTMLSVKTAADWGSDPDLRSLSSAVRKKSMKDAFVSLTRSPKMSALVYATCEWKSAARLMAKRFMGANAFSVKETFCWRRIAGLRPGVDPKPYAWAERDLFNDSLKTSSTSLLTLALLTRDAGFESPSGIIDRVFTLANDRSAFVILCMMVVHDILGGGPVHQSPLAGTVLGFLGQNLVTAIPRNMSQSIISRENSCDGECDRAILSRWPLRDSQSSDAVFEDNGRSLVRNDNGLFTHNSYEESLSLVACSMLVFADDPEAGAIGGASETADICRRLDRVFSMAPSYMREEIATLPAPLPVPKADEEQAEQQAPLDDEERTRRIALLGKAPGVALITAMVRYLAGEIPPPSCLPAFKALIRGILSRLTMEHTIGALDPLEHSVVVGQVVDAALCFQEQDRINGDPEARAKLNACFDSIHDWVLRESPAFSANQAKPPALLFDSAALFGRGFSMRDPIAAEMRDAFLLRVAHNVDPMCAPVHAIHFSNAPQ